MQIKKASLSDNEFLELMKTSKIAMRFYRNKFILSKINQNNHEDYLFKRHEMMYWLQDNCKDIYYFESNLSNNSCIYFYDSDDAILFKLTFTG